MISSAAKTQPRGYGGYTGRRHLSFAGKGQIEVPDFMHGNIDVRPYLFGTMLVKPHLSGKINVVPHLYGDFRTNP